MTGTLWRERVDGPVVVASFENPPLDVLTTRAFGELSELVDKWATAADLRAVVLTGRRGGAFVAHFSVEEIVGGLDGIRAPTGAKASALFRRLNELPQPVIAALNGDCLGGGLELALAADLRVAQRGDFRIGLPEVRLGIIPGAGGTQRLARMIGAGATLDLLLRAKVLSPEQAYACGVVQELADDAVAVAVRIAHEIAALPPAAVASAKAAVHQGADLPLDAGVRVEADASLRAKLAPEAGATLRGYLALPVDRRRAWLVGERVDDGTGQVGE